ncbi:hypothetical protein [Flagellimonas oceanensis]|uniref:hypothetical protein n=1 Tax=Flagellimonas oceanensis TaxID=2499163 RepID=UPI003BA868F0
MWISKPSDWKPEHTDLSKYFIEKIKQQVDPSEIISNKHRTTNGLTLIREIINVGQMTKKRSKYKNRLASVLDESKDNSLSSSIVNDYIIKRYFSDILKYYFTLDTKRLIHNEKEINALIIKSKIFYNRVKSDYYNYILKEIEDVDFSSEKFRRESDKIDKIVSCFTTYVLFLGYSTTSLSEIAYRYIFKSRGESGPKRLVQHFDGKQNEFKFIIKTESNSEEFLFIRENLNENKVTTKKVQYKNIKNKFLEDNLLNVTNKDELFELSAKSLDPHNFLRLLYDEGLKRFVANNSRSSLSYFTPFFDNVCWRFGKATSDNNHKYRSSKILLDPINVPQRPNTLKTTLEKLAKDYGFEGKIAKGIPSTNNLLQPLYFYNLALGSKSIENSISLLWTALEVLIPYRLKDYDIQNVQHFVSKSLAVGSIGRELVSFVQRFVETNNMNQNKLSSDTLKAQYLKLTPNSIKLWCCWLCTDYANVRDEDPFEKIKELSNLLCKEYCKLNDLYGKKESSVNYWNRKIQSSRMSIKYQLDRIYLHRNQIVHTGKFINEYSNLWAHLEWYIGKLLAYAIIRSMEGDKDLEKIFIELHADNEQVVEILQKNKNKGIRDIQEYFEQIFKHSWQMF